MMGTFETALLILLIADSIALVVLVLLQQSRGADVGAAFGSGSAGALFGASGGASFLVKLTTVLAVLFFVITFGLGYIAHVRADITRGIEFIEEEVAEDPASGEVIEVPGDDLPPILGDDLPAVVEEPPIATDTNESSDSVSTNEDEIPVLDN